MNINICIFTGRFNLSIVCQQIHFDAPVGQVQYFKYCKPEITFSVLLGGQGGQYQTKLHG